MAAERLIGRNSKYVTIILESKRVCGAYLCLWKSTKRFPVLFSSKVRINSGPGGFRTYSRGALKMQDMKGKDLTLAEQLLRTENSEPEIDGPAFSAYAICAVIQISGPDFAV